MNKELFLKWAEDTTKEVGRRPIRAAILLVDRGREDVISYAVGPEGITASDFIILQIKILAAAIRNLAEKNVVSFGKVVAEDD